MEKKRIYAYDIAKGIGILLVVIGHYLPEFSFLRNFIFSFHMPLFFLLSGAVMTTSDQSTRETIYQAVKRLSVNYVFWSVIYIAFDFFISYLVLGLIGLPEFLRNIYSTFSLFGISVLWFFPALICAKILTILISRTIKSRIWLTVIAVAMFFIPTTINDIFHIADNRAEHFYIYTILISILRSITVSSFVLLGHTYKDILEKIVTSTRKYIWGLSLLLLLNFIYPILFKDIVYFDLRTGTSIVSFLVGLSGVIGTLAISSLMTRKGSWFTKFWSFLSNHSIFILATHQHYIIYFSIRVSLLMMFNIRNVYLNCLIIFVLEILMCRTISPYVSQFTQKLVHRLDDLKENLSGEKIKGAVSKDL